MNLQQEQFLADELFSLVLQATFQRSLTYEEKVSDAQKANFKQGLRDQLEALTVRYRAQKDRPVPSEEHIQNIESLANTLSSTFGECLIQRRFRIGSAQKALNLHLKYLWCLGEVAEPPHCPFDGIIVKKLGLQGGLNWTELDDIQTYRQLVKLAATAAEKRKLSIAAWELDEYNNP